MDGDRGVIDATPEEEKERLDADDLATGDLLAATHLHRYELAAAALGEARVLDLCCGTGYGSRVLAEAGATVHGVDVAAEAIAAAEEAAGPRLSFERADALEYLRRTGADAFDAVVCFEGIEHVPDADAVAGELARLAEGGVRVMFSLPNSRGFGERNRFHVTDFGWEESQALIARFEDPVVLGQHLLEGSLLVPVGERPPEAATRLIGDTDRDDPAWAGHWIAMVGFDASAARQAAARLAFAAAPHQSAYVRDLELANAELRRMNARLARSWLGLHDAAAASVVRGLEEQREAARKWKEIADNNDFARQGLERRLESPAHRGVDALRDLVRQIPGLGLVMRIARRRSG